MAVFLLPSDLEFPDPAHANPDGLLAVGGDLCTERLLLAYRSGIFPWFNAGDPILWWSPDPRCVLYPGEIKISRSMRNVLNRGRFEVKYDLAFSQVMRKCGSLRMHLEGTWITPDMIEAYQRLHDLGMAHSVEVYSEGRLCGGLYGVSLGGVFFGESMFSEVANASKVALITLCRDLEQRGFGLIDCQLPTDHLFSMGAVAISRDTYLETLKGELAKETLRGDWSVISDLPENSPLC